MQPTTSSQWRELLVSFSNVKTLHVHNGYRRQISRSLQVGDGESSSELLSELKELQYLPPHYVGNAFNAFIDARVRRRNHEGSDGEFESLRDRSTRRKSARARERRGPDSKVHWSLLRDRARFLYTRATDNGYVHYL